MYLLMTFDLLGPATTATFQPSNEPLLSPNRKRHLLAAIARSVLTIKFKITQISTVVSYSWKACQSQHFLSSEDWKTGHAHKVYSSSSSKRIHL